MRYEATKGRLGSALAWVLYSCLLAGPIFDVHGFAHRIPSAIQLVFILTATVYLIRKLLTFKRWKDELQHVKKFVLAVGGLLLVIVAENFATWATSATDRQKYKYAPLQDNVEIATLWAMKRFPISKTIILGWKVDMHWLLYCFVALCLSVIWDVVPYSGFAMGARFMDTIAWTHALRTIAFMITVLPNPRLNCYARSFPPVPSSVQEFIAIGFSGKRGSGCNDLVISGHGVVYAAVPLAVSEFYPFRWTGRPWVPSPAAVAWAGVLKLCLQEVVDKTHYSVDMLLAVAITALVWEWRRSALYDPATAAWRRRKLGAAADQVPRVLIALVVAVLVIVFVGVKGV